MTDYLSLDQKYQLDLYPKRELVLVRGKNAKVWDDHGKEYIDCVAGIGVASIGHCNEKIVKALKLQSEKLITCPGIFSNDARSLLLEKLIKITPNSLEKVFLCNSGAESIEAAIKLTRLNTERTEFICAMRGFHGRTLGALSATFNPKYRDGYEPLFPGFHFVPFNNFAKLKEKVTKNTAAIILEIVQGEGGINIGEKDFFDKVKILCKERDILLIIDEIQTGFCRTGKLFACNHFDIEPDILCLAKAIAGGFPMGAVLCSNKIKVGIGKHGSTFGGNPLACSVAMAAIDFMMENHLDRLAQEKGDYFTDRLKLEKLSKVREIRHLGLMVGIELKEKVQPILLQLQESGVLVSPAGPIVLRLLPPLTIDYEDLDIVANKLVHVLN